MSLLRLLYVLVLSTLTLGGAQAQGNLFAPVATVNDLAVTRYELNQRILFFEVLRAPGNLEEQALDRLIDERLQLQAAKRMGIKITDADILTGMEEFAARANLTPEEFVKAIAPAGVEPETFRDFVYAGLVWRNVVRARFGPKAGISDREVDTAIARAPNASGVRVLLNEIFLPANTPERLAAAQKRSVEIANITTLPAFSAAARRYSAAPSAGRGGRMNWIPLSNLPPAVASQVLALAPGQVTAPIPVPNAIALFQLRALEETGAPEAVDMNVEFARYFIPGGRTTATLAEAEKIKARTDTCDDLYAIAKGQPAERLLRDTKPMAEVQGDIALELARLDPGEVSTNLTTGDGQAVVFLMLCKRIPVANAEADRSVVRQNLFQQRMGSFAEGYLAELRADAIIRRFP